MILLKYSPDSKSTIYFSCNIKTYKYCPTKAHYFTYLQFPNNVPTHTFLILLSSPKEQTQVKLRNIRVYNIFWSLNYKFKFLIELVF